MEQVSSPDLAAGRIRPGRLAVVLGAIALGIFALAAIGARGPGALPLRCAFHDLTGLNCPGCGMTRATHSALAGRFAEAWRFNPVGMVLLPVGLIALALEAVDWVRGTPGRWRIVPGARGGYALAGLVIAFWILRNLPWWPFTQLAPPG